MLGMPRATDNDGIGTLWTQSLLRGVRDANHARKQEFTRKPGMPRVFRASEHGHQNQNVKRQRHSENCSKTIFINIVLTIYQILFIRFYQTVHKYKFNQRSPPHKRDIFLHSDLSLYFYLPVCTCASVEFFF